MLFTVKYVLTLHRQACDAQSMTKHGFVEIRFIPTYKLNRVYIIHIHNVDGSWCGGEECAATRIPRTKLNACRNMGDVSIHMGISSSLHHDTLLQNETRIFNRFNVSDNRKDTVESQTKSNRRRQFLTITRRQYCITIIVARVNSNCSP